MSNTPDFSYIENDLIRQVIERSFSRIEKIPGAWNFLKWYKQDEIARDFDTIISTHENPIYVQINNVIKNNYMGHKCVGFDLIPDNSNLKLHPYHKLAVFRYLSDYAREKYDDYKKNSKITIII